MSAPLTCEAPSLNRSPQALNTLQWHDMPSEPLQSFRSAALGVLAQGLRRDVEKLAEAGEGFRSYLGFRRAGEVLNRAFRGNNILCEALCA